MYSAKVKHVGRLKEIQYVFLWDPSYFNIINRPITNYCNTQTANLKLDLPSFIIVLRVIILA